MEIIEIYETYKLPEIKYDSLTEVEYEHRCKYLRLYIRIIERCKNMTEAELSVPCEIHHILPRCLKGTNVKSNLVKMPVRYHIMAHIVILEAYPTVGGLIESVAIMLGSENNNCAAIQMIRRHESLTKYFSIRTVSRLREKYILYRGSKEYRDGKTGPNNPNYGKKTPEKVKEKISNTVKDLWKNTDTYKNVLNNLKKTREDSYKSKKVVGPDGTIYNSVLDAVDASGIPSSTLRGWMKGISKNNHGWSYLDSKNSKRKKRIDHKLV